MTEMNGAQLQAEVYRATVRERMRDHAEAAAAASVTGDVDKYQVEMDGYRSMREWLEQH